MGLSRARGETDASEAPKWSLVNKAPRTPQFILALARLTGRRDAGVIRAASLHRGAAGWLAFGGARRRIAKAALVNIDNRCKKRIVATTQLCIDPPT